MRTISFGRERGKQCCMEDEGRPLEIGLQGQVSNHLELRGSRARVVSVEGAPRARQVWTEETNASEPLMTGRNERTSTSKAGWLLLRDQVQGEPADCLGGVRPKDGVNSVWASMGNVGTCRPDAKGRTRVGRPHEGASTEAGHRGGGTRSSEDGRESGWSKGVPSSGHGGRSTRERGGAVRP
jgi:hypothetical protein